jgi:hypothetical protein
LSDHLGRKEPMPIDERFWRKTRKAAIGDNPIRILVELITNSVDSYRRLEHKGPTDSSSRIWVKFGHAFQHSGSIEVKDEAEGMDTHQIRASLTYGAATSGITEGFGVRGAMGFGLKDSFMAMEGSKIVSIRDGKISEFEFVMEEGKPYRISIREDEPIKEQEREMLGIKGNGTIVKGLLPKEFKRLKIEQVKQLLTTHYMMRRILQIPKLEILVTDGSLLVPPERLTYSSPIGRVMVSKRLTVTCQPFGVFNANVVVRKASRDLSVHGEYRESGLVHYHDDHAVVDCTLWSFDSDPLARRFFGEVEIENFSLFLKEEEDVVDEKRRGLNKKHPFVEKLAFEIDTLLRYLVEDERRSFQEDMFSLDPRSLREALNELNKIAKEEGALGRVHEPQHLKTRTVTFYPSYVEAFQHLGKTVYLVVNPLIVDGNRQISLRSDTSKIEVHPKEIRISEDEVNDKRCFSRRITVLGKEIGLRGQIGAEIGDYVATLTVMVVANPMMTPDGGFAFIPNETKVVDHNEKAVDLTMEKTLIESVDNPGGTVLFSTSNLRISCPEKLELPQDLSGCLLGQDVVRLQVPIGGEGIGQKGKIIAQYHNSKAELGVEVVPPFETHGLFKEIKFQPGEGVNTISYFDRDQGIIYIYETHPLIEKYWTKKDFPNALHFLVFAADTIARLICWEILKERERKGALEILNPENKLNEMQTYFDELYFKRGRQFHDLLINVIKTMKGE